MPIALDFPFLVLIVGIIWFVPGPGETLGQGLATTGLLFLRDLGALFIVAVVSEFVIVRPFLRDANRLGRWVPMLATYGYTAVYLVLLTTGAGISFVVQVPIVQASTTLSLVVLLVPMVAVRMVTASIRLSLARREFARWWATLAEAAGLVWARLSYVSVALLLSMMVADCTDTILAEDSPWGLRLSIAILLIGLFFYWPWFVLLLGPTTPLPSPWKTRFLSIAAIQKYRVSCVRCWPNSSTGAASFGFWPATGVIIIGDGFAELPESATVDAVFAHELAHLSYHHGLLLVLAMASWGGLALEAGQLARDWSSEPMEWIVLGLILVGFAPLVLRPLLKQFEFEADRGAMIYLVDQARSEPTAPGQSVESVVAAYAERTANTLRWAAQINDLPLDYRSWRGDSVGERLAALEKYQQDSPACFIDSKRDQRTRRSLMLGYSLVFAWLIVFSG